MTQSDLDTIRTILFGADVARLEQAAAAERDAAGRNLAGLDQKVEKALAAMDQKVAQRLEELSQRVTAQLEDLSRRQQAHAEKVTQLLDQVMAELSRRTDALTTETRAAMEELRGRVAEMERRKLNVAEFGASLAALGQRYASAAEEAARR